jgi:hypothetical protein
MNLRSTLTPCNNAVRAQITLDEDPSGALPAITPAERQNLAAFGPLSVNVGGLVHPNSGDDVTLPDSYVNIPNDFPVVQLFSFSDHTNANLLASAWVDLVVGNIDTARTALMAKTPTASSKVYTLPLS